MHVNDSFRALLLVVSLLLVAGAGVAHAAPDSAPVFARSGYDQPPNVLVVVLDDATTQVLEAMPATQARVADAGVEFDTGIVPTALCCPSRASLLTGRHSHSTGTWVNGGPHGGWSSFAPNEDRTLAVALSDVGYRTGLFGKYLNGFAKDKPSADYVPAGWDAFRTIKADAGGDGAYYRYALEGTGPVEHFGSAPRAYSTDVLKGEALDFIGSTPTDQPWLAVLTPYGVHSPYVPAPRHEGSWSGETDPRVLVPAFNVRGDRGTWYRAEPKLEVAKVRRVIRRQFEVARSLDELVVELLDAAGPNTLTVVLSDNGYNLGSHRLTGKDEPFKASSEVPIMMRWDGVLEPGVSARVTTNVDVAATILAAAGGSLPQLDGVPVTEPRSGTLLEQMAWENKGGQAHPAYCGWRTRRYLYVEWDQGTSRPELYDYRRDDGELVNRARRAGYADRVAELRALAQAGCSPTPPGFSW